MKDDSDSRRVPSTEGRGEVREKASRFFAVAFRADTVAAAEMLVARLRREYHDATHVAFAWKIGKGDAAATRASDAGEPSGTAGKPLAGAIESAGLTDVAVGVARYFGGTKLGTGGLARAYRLAAERALATAGAAVVYETVRVEVRCAHGSVGIVRRLLDPPHVRLLTERFTPEPVFALEVRRSRLEAITAKLDAERLPYEVV